jgi:GntR family transcriptional regulator, uxu operon transcriptional repressor
MTSYIQVKEALRARIANGSWATGSKLPPERGLAEEFSASRNTIRKAIKSLAAEAYVSTTENSRPVVAYVNRSVPNSALATERGNESDGGSGDDYIRDSSPLEVLEARLVIEPEAVALAALRARSEDIEEIRKALSESLAAKNLADFEHWDGQLHQAIFRATRNTALMGYYRTVTKIRNQPNWIALKKKSVTAERQRLYDRQHTAIVNAIVARLPDKAKSAMRAHLESVRRAMMP